MITVTNRLGLPETLVRAVINDRYERGDCDFTVTELLKPPQIRAFDRANEIPEDVCDRIWALMGQAIHVILERAADGEPGVIAEKRLYMTVNVDGKAYKVGGGFDHLQYEGKCLTDWKITSVYARAGKDEWAQQLNLLALLLRANNREVERLQNVLIFRDWRPLEAMRGGDGDYPRHQVGRVSIELWPTERTIEFLHQRIRDHVAPTPRPCTGEERWEQPTKHALMKKGAKRAIKLYDAIPPNVHLMPGQFWETRPGAFRRCESYCPVSHLCPQWALDKPAPEPELTELLEKSIEQSQSTTGGTP